MPLPIAHSAAGIAAYICATPKSYFANNRLKGTLLLFTVMLLAVCPDLDFLPGILIGKPNTFHHGPSHSLASVTLISLSVWFICKRFFKGIPPRKIIFLIFISTTSHLFLDFFSSDTSFPFGIPILWPISAEYFVSPFPLFRDITRTSSSNITFFKSLFNSNNGWEVIIEIFFLLMLCSAAFIARQQRRSQKVIFAISVLFIAATAFYALQIEPNWLQIKQYNITNSNNPQNSTLVHISDLHLKSISYRENRLKRYLEGDIKPTITVFTGDTFDPINYAQKKILLSEQTKALTSFISSLPGEKFLVWGEGISNSRHLLSQFLSQNNVTILEDTTIVPKTLSEISITGKLPELADLHLTKQKNSTFLTADSTELNSYLHYANNNSNKWQDYTFKGQFRFDQKAGGMGLTFYSQYTPFSDRFYRIRWSAKDPKPAAAPHGTGELSGELTSKSVLQPNQNYLFKIRIETKKDNTNFQAKFWPANSQEPDKWDIKATDNSANRLSRGTIGVWVNGEAGVKRFDNFEITSNAEPQKTLLTENFEYTNRFKQQWKQERLFIKQITPKNPKQFNILLAHSPEIINKYKITNFDIILTGDTHGGQVRWPWGSPIIKDKKLPPDWYSGLHDLNGQKIYTSKGIGTSRLPIRLFCRPEIAVFKF